MTANLADRVKETSASMGTGNLTLAGAVVGFQSFNAAFGVGTDPTNVFYYAIETLDSRGIPSGDWEVGIGHLSSSTIFVRDSVLDSSNSNTFVDLSPGTKNVFCTDPADFLKSLGGGPPGGDDTNVQFNDGGSFGGDAGFTYDIETALNVALTNTGVISPGGAINLAAGPGGGSSGDGGDVTIVSGRAGAGIADRSGNVVIHSGFGTGGINSIAGDVSIYAAYGTGSGATGNINIYTFQSQGNGQAGDININSAIGGVSGGDAGSINIIAGYGIFGPSQGGDITLSPGNSLGGAPRDGLLILVNIPLLDPGVSGAVWNDSGTLKISP